MTLLILLQQHRSRGIHRAASELSVEVDGLEAGEMVMRMDLSNFDKGKIVMA